MSTRSQTQIKAAPTPSFTPTRSGLLQRKCACGGAPGLTGECDDCRKKRLTSQHRSDDQAEPSTMPSIVQEVLRSPGRPLDPSTRAYMEPHFGHDFSRVRVHTDAQAAESARAVNALAYTVGHNVVFAANQHAPETHHGRQLLAHELAHTVQQRTATGAPPSTDPHGVYESSAEAAGRAIAKGGAVSNDFPACGVGLSRAPDSPAVFDKVELARQLQEVTERLKQPDYPGRDRDLAVREALLAISDEEKEDEDEPVAVSMDISKKGLARPIVKRAAKSATGRNETPSKFSPGGFTDKDVYRPILLRRTFEQASGGNMVQFAEILDSIRPLQEHPGYSQVILGGKVVVLSQDEADELLDAFQFGVLTPLVNRIEDTQRLTDEGEHAVKQYHIRRFNRTRGRGSFKEMFLWLQHAQGTLEDKEAADARWGGFGSNLIYHSKRFGKGAVEGAKNAVTEPFKQLHDLSLIALHETVGLDVDEDDLISNTAKAHRAGASQTRLLLSSNPITGIGVTSYDMTRAIIEGRSGDVSELGGGLTGGMLVGALLPAGRRSPAANTSTQAANVTTRPSQIPAMPRFTDVTQRAQFIAPPPPSRPVAGFGRQIEPPPTTAYATLPPLDRPVAGFGRQIESPPTHPVTPPPLSPPVAGFGRQIQPPPPGTAPQGPPVVTQMPPARWMPPSPSRQGVIGQRRDQPAKAMADKPPRGDKPEVRPAGGQTPPRRQDTPEYGQVERDVTDPRRYVVKEHFGETGAAGQRQPRYHVDVKLNDKGIMEGDFVLRREGAGGSYRSGSLRGKDEFMKAKKYFEQKNGPGSVKGIQTDWGHGDNLAAFNKGFNAAKAQGLPDDVAMRQAASKTHTGQWAAEAGFGKVTIVTAEKGSGGFTQVEVVFER